MTSSPPTFPRSKSPNNPPPEKSPMRPLAFATNENGQLSEQAVVSFKRLRNYAEKNNLSRRDIAQAIGYDESVVSKIYNLKDVGNPAHIIKAIDGYFTQAVPVTIDPKNFPFVETQRAKSVWSYIDLVRTSAQRIGTIKGDSQSGKTRPIEEWIKRHPEIDSLFLQMPTGGALVHTIDWFCVMRGISPYNNVSMKKIDLERTITPNTVIFLDEIQKIQGQVKSRGRMSATRYETPDYFRRLRDTRGCTVIYGATTDVMDDALLVELRRRSIPTYNLPAKPTKSDLDAFAAKLGLPPAETREVLDFQKATIDTDGLGVWLTYLQSGHKLAHAQGRSFTWNDVLAADAIFQKGTGRK